MPTFKNEVTGNEEPAILGVSPKGRGVVGWSETEYGVSGDSKKSAGIRGTSLDGRGTEGWSTNGEGVVGISANSTGVWGQTEGAGTGVAGTSKAGKGIHGVSESGSGVYGQSQSGRAIEGWSETNYGVTGDSRTFPGVRGTSVEGRGMEGWSTKGAGVFGISQKDIGVHGKGGKLAGFFEGDVDIVGKLTVNGISLHALLERIIQLEEAVAAIRSSPIGVQTSSIPSIRVSREGSGTGSVFVIEGSGFLPNKTVIIRVVDDALNTRTFPHSADASGKIGVRQSISCTSGLTMHFSATDSRSNPSDITGVLWSNTFTTICP